MKRISAKWIVASLLVGACACGSETSGEDGSSGSGGSSTGGTGGTGSAGNAGAGAGNTGGSAGLGGSGGSGGSGGLGGSAGAGGVAGSAGTGGVAGSAGTGGSEVPGQAHWPLEVLSWDMTIAHPNVPYEWRLGVKGGSYPYHFALTGPAGMTVDNAGTLRWAPTSAAAPQAVEVLITDSLGNTLTHTFDITVTTTGFYFVDGSSGSDSAAGTLGNPWKTLDYASANAGDGFVYVRAGTYDAGGIEMNASAAHRWIAYPADNVVWDLGGNSIRITKGLSVIMGFEVRNGGAKMFWGGITPNGIIWRKNDMHGVSSTGWNNPAHIFFEDGNHRPVDGDVQYDRIVIQENTFHDLTNPNNHGASVTCYNVKNMLYEDNEAYDIDGRGVSDKDDGYYNTIRNNVLHDNTSAGVGLYSQYTQAEIEVNYNLVYDNGDGIVVGAHPGYIRNIYVHHNTFVNNAIKFGSITDGAESGDFEVYRNIVVNGGNLIYELVPVSGSSGYQYPSWTNAPVRAEINHNLMWTTGSHVAGYDWGLTNESLSTWQSRGFDPDSLLANPELDANHRLPASSPYLGFYGR